MGLFEAVYIARSNAHTAARYSDEHRPATPTDVVAGVVAWLGVGVWFMLVIGVCWIIEATLGLSTVAAVVVALGAAVVVWLGYYFVMGALDESQ